MLDVIIIKLFTVRIIVVCIANKKNGELDFYLFIIRTKCNHLWLAILHAKSWDVFHLKCWTEGKLNKFLYMCQRLQLQEKIVPEKLRTNNYRAPQLSRTEMSKKNLSMNIDLGIAEGAVRSSLEVENQENFLMRVSYLSGTNLQEPHIPHRMSE